MLLLLVWLDPLFSLAYVGVFFIILLHELGHSLAGRYYGCLTQRIVLYPFGGAAQMVIPERPLEELVIALAGPLVNLLFLPVLWSLAHFHDVLWQLALANTALLVFNLIPAFPMDGGRVLRTVLSAWHKDRIWATRIAVIVAKVFCICFGILSLVLFNPILMLIAIVVWMSGEAELQNIMSQQAIFGSENPDVDEFLRIIRKTDERLRRLEERNSN